MGPLNLPVSHLCMRQTLAVRDVQKLQYRRFEAKGLSLAEEYNFCVELLVTHEVSYTNVNSSTCAGRENETI